MSDPAIDDVRATLRYEPDSGHLVWIISPANSVPAGSIAGTINSRGYRLVPVKGKRYRAHRLAWLLTHGSVPTGIDHINGLKDDNRLANLRPATQAENLQNTALRRNNSSGYPGVHWFGPMRKWRAKINKGGVEHMLGYFESAADAGAAYASAKARLHTFQPNVRASHA